MNVTIKQRSISLAFLMMLISGGALFAMNGMPQQFAQIAELLMGLALAGLVYWLYKRR
jgi:Na+/H+ antiporter NhaC